MRQVKIEYSFKNIDRDYEILQDVPVEVTDQQVTDGIASIKDIVEKCWKDGASGILTIGEKEQLIRIDDLRTFAMFAIES